MIGLKVQSISDFLFRTIFLFFIWALSSCGSTQVISANSSPAVMASEPLSPEEVLDIGIITFDPNIPNDIEESNENLVVPDVRRAESRYIAYHLKNTLENTGNWGAVRVLPNSTESSHIEISGKILSSDGEMLRIKITAIDSKKNKWIERIFEDRATGLGYENPTEDPFQDLYNEIANELLAFKASLSSRDSANIKEIAKLRFARDLAPEKFDGYLVKIETIKVDKKDIATVIGKGGATIREIVETSGAKVDVKDTGEVTVAAPDEASRNKAIDFIKNLIAKPEMGKIYKGKVVKIMEFGAFVNFLGKQDGLVHISELAEKRVAKVGDVVKEGDEVSVKVVGFDRGKVKLSMKQAGS